MPGAMKHTVTQCDMARGCSKAGHPLLLDDEVVT